MCLTACIVTVWLLGRMSVLSQSEDGVVRRDRLGRGPTSRLARCEATAGTPVLRRLLLNTPNSNTIERWIKSLEKAFLDYAAQM